MKKILNLMLTVLATALVLQSCKPKPNDKDIQSIVESYVKAIASDDFDKAQELATSGSDSMLQMQKVLELGGYINDTVLAEMNAAKELEMNATLTFGATTFSEDGSKAVVNYTSSAGGGEETIHLQNVDGKWLIDMKADMPNE